MINAFTRLSSSLCHSNLHSTRLKFKQQKSLHLQYFQLSPLTLFILHLALLDRLYTYTCQMPDIASIDFRLTNHMLSTSLWFPARLYYMHKHQSTSLVQHHAWNQLMTHSRLACKHESIHLHPCPDFIPVTHHPLTLDKFSPQHPHPHPPIHPSYLVPRLRILARLSLIRLRSSSSSTSLSLVG